MVKKYFNYLKNRREYHELFKVIEDGFEGINPEDLLEDKILSAEEVSRLAALLDSEEEVEDMQELLEKAFEVDPESTADILDIPIYEDMESAWEEYHPDVA